MNWIWTFFVIWLTVHGKKRKTLCGTLLKPHNEPRPPPPTSPNPCSPCPSLPDPSPTTQWPTTHLVPPPTSSMLSTTTEDSGPPWHQDVPLIINPSDYTSVNKYSCALSRYELPVCSCVIISETLGLTPCDKCSRDKYKVYIPDDFEVQYAYFEFESDVAMDIISNPLRRFIRHPECYDLLNHYKPDHDIAIIQMEGKTQLSAHSYAVLPKNNDFNWDWSRHVHMSNFRVLNILAVSRKESVWHVLTKTVNNTFCMNLLATGVGQSNICTSYYHIAGSNNCASDFGTGLTVRKHGSKEEILIGILIHKYECGRPRSVASFANIITHVKWIRQQIKQYSNGKEIA